MTRRAPPAGRKRRRMWMLVDPRTGLALEALRTRGIARENADIYYMPGGKRWLIVPCVVEWTEPRRKP